MTGPIISHNVKVTLSDDRAEAALTACLVKKPSILGLQEWGRGRRRPLAKNAAPVRFVTTLLLKRKVKAHPSTGYAFAYPRLGGQPVLVDVSFGTIVACRLVPLSKRRKGVRATYGTETLIVEHATNLLWAVLNVHPVAHPDRPANKAAWGEAIESIEDWADTWTGHPRVVLGDMNKQLMRIGPLRSCWYGHPKQATGPGGGCIDHVYTSAVSVDVDTIRTTSDHKAVVATYV